MELFARSLLSYICCTLRLKSSELYLVLGVQFVMEQWTGTIMEWILASVNNSGFFKQYF